MRLNFVWKVPGSGRFRRSLWWSSGQEEQLGAADLCAAREKPQPPAANSPLDEQIYQDTRHGNGSHGASLFFACGCWDHVNVAKSVSPNPRTRRSGSRKREIRCSIQATRTRTKFPTCGSRFIRTWLIRIEVYLNLHCVILHAWFQIQWIQFFCLVLLVRIKRDTPLSSFSQFCPKAVWTWDWRSFGTIATLPKQLWRLRVAKALHFQFFATIQEGLKTHFIQSTFAVSFSWIPLGSLFHWSMFWTQGQFPDKMLWFHSPSCIFQRCASILLHQHTAVSLFVAIYC